MNRTRCPPACLSTVTALASLFVATAALSAEGPPDGSTPEQRAAIAADPPFVRAAITLDAPAAKPGAKQNLFNGRDLSDWDSWLGYADPRLTYADASKSPIGLNGDRFGVFTVATVDGAPAIHVSGEKWGALITKREYSNYHLHVEFKWGEKNWMPMPRNNGVLYHSHGRYGAFFGTWMAAVEFEVVPKSVGMILCVGDSQGGNSFAGVDWKVGASVEVGHDPAIAYPSRRWMPGGRLVPILFPGFNVDAAVDAERPAGQWNSLDLYVYGDRSVHVVNGVLVMEARDLTTTDGTGKPHRLTKGKIQLQSEGAETWFRNITLEPISRLPVVRTTGK